MNLALYVTNVILEFLPTQVS